MPVPATVFETPLIVSARGQITLPKRAREKLGLKGGSVLLMMEKDGRLVLAPAAVTPVEQYSDQDVARLLKLDRLSKRERKEALRSYVRDRNWLAQFEARAAKLPVYTPTKRELQAIQNGREEMERGEFVTLDELVKEVEGGRGQAGGKGPRPRSRGRRRAA